MRTLLLSLLAATALSACGQDERTDLGRHADEIEQPADGTAPADADSARNLPGGGSGTAASEEQRSGQDADSSAKRNSESPPKR